MQEKILESPWQYDCSDVLESLDVDPETGLSEKQAAERQKKFGKNMLKKAPKKGKLEVLVNQFKSVIILILAAASLLAFIFTDWIEGLAILVAIVINTLIGFFMELKAIRSMESLREMEQLTAKAVRDDEIKEIAASELVPGDIVVFEGGDIVSADLRLLEASKLQVNESMLTGESVPVSKYTDPVGEEAEVAQRSNMLFKGTSLTRGSAKAVVTAIGENTELGNISSLIEESGDEFTPLEKRLGKLGTKLLWVIAGILIIVAILGIIRGKDIVLMVETAVALAVAAIPEGLPIVATIAMARGMLRMARHNALVNRLAAVETLGGTNVIFTDKTGTLTENKMTVTKIVLASGDYELKGVEEKGAVFERNGEPVEAGEDQLLKETLNICVLCNNASVADDGEAVGDPLEVALLEAGLKVGMDRDEMLDEMPEEREEAFDTDTKKMATFNKQNGGLFVAVKGAPEAVLDVCSKYKTADGIDELDEDVRGRWAKCNQSLAEEGLRVIAVASKRVSSTEAKPYEDLEFLGMVAMMDPPREGVKEAISLCRKAGLKVVMVTGDQAATALKIAQQIGLVKEGQQEAVAGSEIKPAEEIFEQEKKRFLKTSIFARVTPEQKLDLVSIHQDNFSTVAMTGDGVNDAPGLHKADIGVAMGGRGTQVAQEASDMILKDDSFSTIVEAIKQGRIIFRNIRKFIIYLLSGNAAEILIVLFASVMNIPLPILPLQILLLNIISDVFPALALGLGEGTEDVMKHPPRDPREPVLTWKHWAAIFGYGLLIAVPVTAIFIVSLRYMNLERLDAVTISFLTLAFARLWHIFNMRDRDSKLVINDVTTNKYVWGALVLCTVLLLGFVYVPGVSTVLKLRGPSALHWGIIISCSFIPLILGQLLKLRKPLSK